MDQTHSELIFWQAIQLSDDHERDTHIAAACKGDEQLRQHILDMVAAHFAAEDFLEKEASQQLEDEARLGPGSIVGRYELQRKLATGGMGVVFEARQLVPVRRRVALKLVKPGLEASRVIPRFNVERQALAEMDHPHIAKVLDAGATRSGRPYFVMELVEGLPLIEFCDQHQLSMQKRLELFIEVCQAVQHAHQKGIIHRDLKPSNVLVTIQDGRPVPKVIDFGIAKAMRPLHVAGEPGAHEDDVAQAGTPRYMSPEQAGFDDREVDTRSDIFSLGVLLFELITGETPLEQPTDNRRALLQRLLEEPASLASARIAGRQNTGGTGPLLGKRDVQRIRRELDLIIDKCLQKQPNDRYESASELVRDLQCFLADEPVSVCRGRLGYRVEKTVRRHRFAVVGSLLLSAILAVATGISLRYAYRTHSAESQVRLLLKKERRLRQEATEAADFTERLLYDADLRLAAAAWQEGDPLQAADLLRPYSTGREQSHLRDEAWYLLDHFVRRNGVEHAQLNSAVYDVAWSPDKEQVAVASADGRLRLLNAATWNLERDLDCQQGELNGVSFSPDGKWVATAGDDGTVRLWTWPLLEPRHRLEYGERLAFSTAFVQDGTAVAVCGNGPQIPLFRVSDGQRIGQLEGHTRTVEAMSLSPDGRLLATASSDDSLRIWDPAQQQVLRTFTHKGGRLLSVAWSPDGAQLAVGGLDGTLLVLDSKSLKVSRRTEHRDAIQAVAFTADGRGLACADRAGSIRFWYRDQPSDAFPKPRARQWLAHRARIYCLRVCPRTGALLSAANDGRIRTWTPSTTQNFPALPISGPAKSFAKHPEVPVLVTAQATNLEISQFRSGNLASAGRLHSAYATSPWTVVQFSPRGDLLAAGTGTGEIVVWNWKTRQPSHTLPLGTPTGIDCLSFSPDSRFLAAISFKGDDQVKIYDLSSAELVEQLPCKQPNGCAFSHNGRWLAVDSQRQVLIFSVPDWRLLHRHRGHDVNIPDLAFAPQSDLLASVGGDRALVLWDPRAGRVLHQSLVSSARLRCLAFSADGKLIATGGYDKTVRLWRTATGRLVTELPPHDARIDDLAFFDVAGKLMLLDQRGDVIALPTE